VSTDRKRVEIWSLREWLAGPGSQCSLPSL
jgi:hypothetical protein